jgi:hypothetical protein
MTCKGAGKRRNRSQRNPIEKARGQVQYLGVSYDFTSRRTRIEHECMAKPFFYSIRKEDGTSVLVVEAHALFFPIADGDDALAFAIPLEVIAAKQSFSCARRVRKRTKEIAHPPRDNLELSLERLILAYGIPNANWPDNAGFRVGYEIETKAVNGGRTGARSVS